MPGVAKRRADGRVVQPYIAVARVFHIAHTEPEQVDLGRFRAISFVHNPTLEILIKPFVEPGFLKLVTGQQLHKVLMAKLMHRYHFGGANARRYPPTGSCRNKCGVFHPRRPRAVQGRVHNGQGRKRITAQNLVKISKGGFHGKEVSVGLGAVFGLHQEPDAYFATRCHAWPGQAWPGTLPNIIHNLKMGRGCPGKIHHIFGMIAEGFGVAGFVPGFSL